jgi:acylphosphatase
MHNSARRAIIRGIVQGVGFRWAARAEAERLGLDGFVRNRPDGSVETVFSGPDAAVAAYTGWLHDGPPSASVSSVELDDTEAEDGRGFELRA